MMKILNYGLLVIVFFTTFFLSGQAGLAVENHTQSIAAGTGLFGISFVGLTTNIVKVWFQNLL